MSGVDALMQMPKTMLVKTMLVLMLLRVVCWFGYKIIDHAEYMKGIDSGQGEIQV